MEEIMRQIVTSESVNIGHPDKTCDTIADAFLDEALRQDPNSQMAVECAIKNNKLFIYGEATTFAKIDYDGIAKKILKDIGYNCEFEIVKEISQQSPEINRAVVREEICANDQGVVYGYATNETKEYMPLPIVVAHLLMRTYEDFRKSTSGFFADAKSQVSVVYEDGKPIKITSILVSVSHIDTMDQESVEKIIRHNVVDSVMKKYSEYVDKDTQVLINPSGRFTIWGSFGDSGCVGRKIIVDTYGGVGRVGGGCFSSKNATKIDRSGAYYARFVAKNIVAQGFADRCEIQVSFAIGLPNPTSISIDCFGTNKKPMSEIEKYVNENFNFRVGDIIDELDLNKPIYQATACYGHFGRDEFSWEKIK